MERWNVRRWKVPLGYPPAKVYSLESSVQLLNRYLLAATLLAGETVLVSAKGADQADEGAAAETRVAFRCTLLLAAAPTQHRVVLVRCAGGLTPAMLRHRLRSQAEHLDLLDQRGP